MARDAGGDPPSHGALPKDPAPDSEPRACAWSRSLATKLGGLEPKARPSRPPMPRLCQVHWTTQVLIHVGKGTDEEKTAPGDGHSRLIACFAAGIKLVAGSFRRPRCARSPPGPTKRVRACFRTVRHALWLCPNGQRRPDPCNGVSRGHVIPVAWGPLDRLFCPARKFGVCERSVVCRGYL